MNKADAYLIKSIARDDEANFQKESDPRISAETIYRLMLGKSWTLDEHRAVKAHYADHEVPAAGGPIAIGPHGLRLNGAVVREQLDLSGCGSAKDPLPSLTCIACQFEYQKEDMLTGAPTIDLSGTHISLLNLAESKFRYLRGIEMHVAGSVTLSRVGPASEEGGLCWCKLSRSVIDGGLIAEVVRMYAPDLSPQSGPTYYNVFDQNWALNLSGSRIMGSVLMPGASEIIGGLLMDFSDVQGDVRIHSATIAPRSDQPAISMERTRIAGSLSFTGDSRRPLTCMGPMWLYQTDVEGSLDLHSAILNDGELGVALYAIGLSVRGWLQIGQEYEQSKVLAMGRLWLQQARIGGDLSVVNVNVSRGKPLRENFKWREEVGKELSVNAEGARVDGTLRLRRNKFKDGVDLSDLRCSTLDDDLTGYGKEDDKEDNNASVLLIDGFRYERLRDKSFECRDRIDKWLPGHGKAMYAPHPYVQLAQVFVNHGQEADARAVLIRKAELDSRFGWLDYSQRKKTHNFQLKKNGSRVSDRLLPALSRWMRRTIVVRGCITALSFLYGLCFDYGLSPPKAFTTMIVGISIGGAMFWLMNDYGAMVVAQTPVSTLLDDSNGPPKYVTQKVVTEKTLSTQSIFMPAQAAVQKNTDNNKRPGPTGSDVACGDSIRALVYAADVFIPLLDLREEGKCDIDLAMDSKLKGWMIYMCRILKALYAVLGWIVTTLAVLTFSGVMRHRALQD